MIGIKINDQWLDLNPDTRIQIKKNTDLYVTGDPEFASNSYSLPFQIPSTPKNRLILSYPDSVETTSYNTSEIQAIIYAGEGSSIGLPLFFGTLYVKKGRKRRASGSGIEVFIIVDGLNNFTSVKMSELPWELYELDTAEDMAEHCKETVENPDDYDYIFASVINPTFYPSRRIPVTWNNALGRAAKVTNYYDRTEERFVHLWGQYVGAVMTPFYKTHVVFKKIVEYMGYSIEDNFHTLDIELQRLLFFNNQNMYKIVDGKEELGTVIDGAKHMVDKITITDFIKQICRYFCLGIFVDQAQKKISITPFKNLLNQADAVNWSSKVSPDFDIDKIDTELPVYIGVKLDSSDEMSQLAEYKNISEYGPADEYFIGNTPSNSFLYFARVNQYWYIKRFQDYLLVTNHFERIFPGGKGSPIELSVSPLLMNVITQISQRDEPFDRINYPQAGIAGKGEYLTQDEDDIWSLINNQASTHETIRLFFYRGAFNNEAGRFLQSGITATDEETLSYAFQYSLLFNGPNSVYERFWKEWLYFMKHKKIIQTTLYLKLSDILSFREYHKVRINGLSYFVKSMDITLTMQGIEPVQAELVSIPMS